MKSLKELWCEIMHDSPMWPIHEHYECRACGLLHAVPWSSDREGTSQTDLGTVTGDGRLATCDREVEIRVARA